MTSRSLPPHHPTSVSAVAAASAASAAAAAAAAARATEGPPLAVDHGGDHDMDDDEGLHTPVAQLLGKRKMVSAPVGGYQDHFQAHHDNGRKLAFMGASSRTKRRRVASALGSLIKVFGTGENLIHGVCRLLRSPGLAEHTEDGSGLVYVLKHMEPTADLLRTYELLYANGSWQQRRQLLSGLGGFTALEQSAIIGRRPTARTLTRAKAHARTAGPGEPVQQRRNLDLEQRRANAKRLMEQVMSRHAHMKEGHMVKITLGEYHMLPDNVQEMCEELVQSGNEMHDDDDDEHQAKPQWQWQCPQYTLDATLKELHEEYKQLAEQRGEKVYAFTTFAQLRKQLRRVYILRDKDNMGKDYKDEM